MDKVWNLTHIYKTQEDFEKDLDYAKKVILPGITELEGKLKNEEDLVKYFDLEAKEGNADDKTLYAQVNFAF